VGGRIPSVAKATRLKAAYVTAKSGDPLKGELPLRPPKALLAQALRAIRGEE
jgi:hypothetical protein